MQASSKAACTAAAFPAHGEASMSRVFGRVMHTVHLISPGSIQWVRKPSSLADTSSHDVQKGILYPTQKTNANITQHTANIAAVILGLLLFSSSDMAIFDDTMKASAVYPHTSMAYSL